MTRISMLVEREAFFNELDQMQARAPSCRNIFCTTCGGLSGAIEHHISDGFKVKMNHFLENLADSSLHAVSLNMAMRESKWRGNEGEWNDIFSRICPTWRIFVSEHQAAAFRYKASVLEQEAEFLIHLANDEQLNNVRELDRCLFQSRKFRNFEPYQKLLEHGIKVAVETSDESLVETLAIILGEDILDHSELFSLAMDLATDQLEANNNLHRILYNALRDKVPAVRGYIGNGNSCYPRY